MNIPNVTSADPGRIDASLAFRADTYRCRVYSGRDALAALPADLRRLGVRRALVVCGQSVARNSELLPRLRALLGDALAGVFDRAGRHADEAAVQATVEAMQAARADGLVAVGAGSVMMHARLAAILHAERRPVDDMVTRYRDDGPAFSPRLDAPKVPIVNVLTAANNAQNRAGSAMRRPGEARRLEMFDPKTRPASIYWDAGALSTAPVALAQSTGFNLLWWSVMFLGGVDSANPLSQADRWQAFRLAMDAWPRLQDPADAGARIAMCAAAFLQTRDEDDGGHLFRLHWTVRVCYALGSGIFTQRDDIDPGAVYAALTCPAMEAFGGRDLREMRRMVGALGVLAGEPGEAGLAELVAGMRQFLARIGQAWRLRDLGVERGELPAIRDFALRNYNADRNRELRREQPLLDAVLEAAW